VSAPSAADYLIIGSGIAGRRAAIELAAHGDVLILTKAAPDAGSTGFAQGGIAAAVGGDDSPARHAADTVAAGDGLCDAAAVRVLVDDGAADVRELIEWGAAFDRAPDGSLELAREGAHSVRRVLHAKDATGREIARVLAARLAGHPRVTIVDHALAIQAVVEEGRVGGVRYLDRDGRVAEARARATLLATGGAGQVFRETTNPGVATGDGVTLAYLAGAQVADLEFVQFHPTALAVPGAPRYLLSEALRGEGARLVNAAGEPFVARYTPAGDLASRDQVSRAIVRESERTAGPVFLTMAHLPAAAVRERFPLITSLCRRAGLDLATDRIPVGPAAHYMMGGVATDLDGRTSLPGLFAAGEIAATGVHGANRLASNSLLEGLVFGLRAGRAMSAWDGKAWPAAAGPTPPLVMPAPEGASWTPSIDEAALRELMWTSAGVIRQADGARGLARAEAGLERAWASLADAVSRGASFDDRTRRVASLLTVGRLIVRAASRRVESRGAHWRTDAPARDDVRWRRRVFEARGSRMK
jgi:L-aspartate oxidase